MCSAVVSINFPIEKILFIVWDDSLGGKKRGTLGSLGGCKKHNINKYLLKSRNKIIAILKKKKRLTSEFRTPALGGAMLTMAQLTLMVVSVITVAHGMFVLGLWIMLS